MKNALATLQPLGRALMLPIAVLPAAGLLLRLGQPDLLNVAFIAEAGNAIFSNLGLLFAVGVAVGLAKGNHGAAGLAGTVCFLVAIKGAEALMTVPPQALSGYAGAAHGLALEAFKTSALNKLGVPAGILSGLIAGGLYNRFHDIRLPDYLAFFGGRRFVPIVAGFAALPLAMFIGLSWAGIEHIMDMASRGILDSGALGLFIYGALNRILIVTGLHHVINNMAWFLLGDYHGTTGDLKRFFAGDPNAGKFMSGFFPVMMFGLPAACLAMYHTARPERRKAVAGLLASLALTAFLTGITEPIEFSFMFLAPLLYALHAMLTGLAMVLMDALHVRLGFGFSAGLFDYVINFDRETRPLLLLPVGLGYGLLYYGVFRFAILRFDLKTLGREDDAAAIVAPPSDERGAAFAHALGGAANLVAIDACTTRLRLVIRQQSIIDEAHLKRLGARGFVRPSANTLQVVLGPIADQVANDIRAAFVNTTDKTSTQEVVMPSVVSGAAWPGNFPDLLTALGGTGNIRDVAICATRLQMGLRDVGEVNAVALKNAGARGLVTFSDSIHVVIGPGAASLAQQLRARLAR